MDRISARTCFTRGDSPATPAAAASENVIRACIGSCIASAWYSWIERGSVDRPRSASMPRTAANTPGNVVTHGTPAEAEAVRMK